MTRHQLHLHLKRHHTHDPARPLPCNPPEWWAWLAGLANQEMKAAHTQAHAYDLVSTGPTHWHSTTNQ